MGIGHRPEEVLGGGAVGVEVAAELVEAKGGASVTLATASDELVPDLPPATRNQALAWLRDRGCLFRDSVMDGPGGGGLGGRSAVGEASLFGGGLAYKTSLGARSALGSSADALRHLSVTRRAAASCVWGS